MNGLQIYVQRASKPITVGVHVLLFCIAQEMQARKMTRFDLKDEHAEGRVTTAWETTLMGTIAGTLFAATIDVGDQTVDITYVVRESDMEEVAAMGLPVVDLSWKSARETVDRSMLN